MLVFRSLTIGLLSACFFLLLARPAIEIRTVRELPRAAPPSRIPTIIDVAPGVTGTQLASMIRLAPGEHITSVDDVPVTSDLAAGVTLARLDLKIRQFIDLGVGGAFSERRVLVLLH